MKTILNVTAVGLALVLAANPAFAGIAASKHDFRAVGGGTPITGVTELCKTCHVPHRPLMNVPLWAHALSTVQYNLFATNADYQGPNAAAFTASPTNLANTKARLCLSCHDGTVAVAGTTYIGSGGNIMWDNGAQAAAANGLKGSHPIAVSYATVRTNQGAEYADITASPDVKLDAGRVSCTSCHNPHNKTGLAKMLVKDNAGSALCTTCHTK